MKLSWKNPQDQVFAKRFISTILYYTSNKQTNYPEAKNCLWWNCNIHVWRDEADVIEKEITERTLDVERIKKIDRSLARWGGKLQIPNPPIMAATRKADFLAKAIVWFCQEASIYWDITDITPELRTELENSIFGKALLESDQALDKNKKPEPAPTPTPRAPGATGPGTGIKKGEGTYARSGQHSSLVKNLVGTPGTKIFPERLKAGGKKNRILYIQTPVSASGKPKGIYIDPINYDAITNTATSNPNSHVIKLGAPHYGWASVLYFDDFGYASQFRDKCQSKLGISLEVVHKKYDENGYYRVSTEFGDAWIAADRLNEDVIAENNEQLDGEKLVEENVSESKYEKGEQDWEKAFNNIDVYDEWFHNSVS